MYIMDPDFVIIVPADAITRNGAKPSAGTVLPIKLRIYDKKSRIRIHISSLG